MARTNTYTVRIKEGDVPALLDMLRYERARVVAWSNVEPGVARSSAYDVTIESEYFTRDRWASFLLFPKLVI